MNLRKWIPLTAAVVLAAAAWLGCGNNYFQDWPASYREETIRLGDVRNEVGPRAAGLAGAGRAAAYGPEAAVSNPAALAALGGHAAAAGAGYRSTALNVQPGPDDTRAQSYWGTFTPSYAAGAYAVAPRRFVVGGALWMPNDFTYTMGKAGTGRVESRGSLRAVGPAAAVNVGGVMFGAGGDYLWGGQDISASVPGVATSAARASGYDYRASVRKDWALAPGWTLAAAAFGRRGARVRWAGDAGYDVQYAPQAGGAVSVRARSISVHMDGLYSFYSRMSSTDAGVEHVVRAVTRDVGWASGGAEYVTSGGVIVRGGISYRPWYILNPNSHGVKSLLYAMGAGWPMMKRHGRLDAALNYGRRGALDVDGYYADVISFELGFGYFW